MPSQCLRRWVAHLDNPWVGTELTPRSRARRMTRSVSASGSDTELNPRQNGPVPSTCQGRRRRDTGPAQGDRRAGAVSVGGTRRPSAAAVPQALRTGAEIRSPQRPTGCRAALGCHRSFLRVGTSRPHSVTHAMQPSPPVPGPNSDRTRLAASTSRTPSSEGRRRSTDDAWPAGGRSNQCDNRDPRG